MDNFELWAVALYAALIGAVFYWVARMRRKTMAKYEQLAQYFGSQSKAESELSTGRPHVETHYRTRPVRVFEYTRGSGRNKKVYTGVELNIKNPSSLDFHIYEQGFFSTLMTKFGAQDVLTGDDAFDKAFIVKSSKESELLQILTPPVKDRLMEHARAYIRFGLKLNESEFRSDIQGSLRKDKVYERVISTVELMIDMADQVDSVHGRRVQ